MKHVTVKLLVICLIILALPLAAMANEPSPLVGQPAPEFSLVGTDGKTYVMSELVKGKGIFLNFWGIRCGPCVKELPLLNRLHKQYGPDGLVLLGINVDGLEGPDLLEYMKELNIVIDFPVLTDPELSTMEPYRLEGAPLSIFIDSTGVIRHYHLGYVEGDEKHYEEYIKDILPSKS